MVRYPGGNFVSGYRWRDGIGAFENRPRRKRTACISGFEKDRDQIRGCADPLFCGSLSGRDRGADAVFAEYRQRAAMAVEEREHPYERGMTVKLEKYSFHVFRFTENMGNAEKLFGEEEDWA